MKTKYGTSESTKVRDFQTQNSQKIDGVLNCPLARPHTPKSNSCICPCRHGIHAHSFPLPHVPWLLPPCGPLTTDSWRRRCFCGVSDSQVLRNASFWRQAFTSVCCISGYGSLLVPSSDPPALLHLHGTLYRTTSKTLPFHCLISRNSLRHFCSPDTN